MSSKKKDYRKTVVVCSGGSAGECAFYKVARNAYWRCKYYNTLHTDYPRCTRPASERRTDKMNPALIAAVTSSVNTALIASRNNEDEDDDKEQEEEEEQDG